MRETITVPNKMLHQRRLIAFRQTVAPHPALLDVCSVNSEYIAFPLAGGETHPGVRRPGGRMRPAVHPGGTVLFVRADVVLNSNDLVGLRGPFGPESGLKRPTVNVGRYVPLALMLRH